MKVSASSAACLSNNKSLHLVGEIQFVAGSSAVKDFKNEDANELLPAG